MIFFRPSDSGLNSMLGQVMWFKRFCDGCGLDFDVAVDLDASPRNRAEGALHRLFFDEAPRENLRRTFDDRISLREFFNSAISGAGVRPARDILVDAGLKDGAGGGNVWTLHEFQLHCLRNGFLSDRFPYWAAPLDRWTRRGALAQAGGSESRDKAASSLCLIHSRIGDCCVLTRDRLPAALAAAFPKPVFAAQRFMSREDFQLYSFGLHPKMPPRHYAERGARLVDAEAYAAAAAALKQSQDKPVRLQFISDGYTKPAEAIAKASGKDAASVESALNAMLAPVTALSDSVLLGETAALLAPTLQAVMDCDFLISGPSLFAVTTKLAVQGEGALDRWRMLDQSDTLSRYLQLPALVNLPLPVYEARLLQLIATSG